MKNKIITIFSREHKLFVNGDMFLCDTGRQLKRQLMTSGYHFYAFRDENKKQKNFSVHRLVATFFIKKPEGYNYVNHMDGDKLNNVVSNLEWVTFSMNMKHAYKIGLCTPVKRKKLGESEHAKPVIQVGLNNIPIKIFTSIAEAELETGTWHQDISKVCKAKRPTANGFKWQYA